MNQDAIRFAQQKVRLELRDLVNHQAEGVHYRNPDQQSDMKKDINALEYTLRAVVGKNYPDRARTADFEDLRHDLRIFEDITSSLQSDCPPQYAKQAVEDLGLF